MIKPRTTMKDVAEACGVSLSTVSLVLSNNPRISNDTRKRVLAAVDRFGYQPDIHAKGLALKTSGAISIVVPDINHVFADIYFGEIISGIYDCAAEENYKILLDVCNERFVQSREYLNLFQASRVDGMLFISPSLNHRFLREFEQHDYPFLLVNQYFRDGSLNYVTADYAETARKAADHLVGLGHRKIGLITGTNVQTAIDFRVHFMDRCREHGLAEADLPWADGDFREEGGYRCAERLLDERPELTALMGGNDKMAIGAMRYILSQGKDIPAEVSVMGVDDMPAATFTTPGLTSVRHRLYDMGRMACRNLVALFRKEMTTCRKVLPVELVQRESTGPPRKQGLKPRKTA